MCLKAKGVLFKVARRMIRPARLRLAFSTAPGSKSSSPPTNPIDSDKFIQHSHQFHHKAVVKSSIHLEIKSSA
jgi:hypothetical protein